MKNVLLATTALVAMAGAASAAVSWGGDAKVQYNSLGGLTYGTNLSISASADLNNGVTASASWKAKLLTTGPFGVIAGDSYPLIKLESSAGTFSAGEADRVGPASDHFSATTGVTGIAAGNYIGTVVAATPGNFAVRADATFGGFGVSVSEVLVGGTDLRFGVSGSAGSVDFGMGYEANGGTFGLNVGTTVGAVGVKASYNSVGAGVYGISGSYDMGNGTTLGAYYASTGTGVFGATIGYASGPLTVDVAWSTAGTSNIKMGYAVSDVLSLSGGYDVPTSTAFVSANYDLGNGAKVYGSYANGTGFVSTPNGLTIGASMTF